MKDTSGFTNWETRRMFEEVQRKYGDWMPASLGILTRAFGSFERKIKDEGFNTFVPYNQDQVNWWEILGRLHGLRPQE